MDQRLGNQQPALHPARQRARIGIRLVGEAQRLQDFHRPALGLWHRIEPGLDFQYLARAEERVEIDLLRHDADGAAGQPHLFVDIGAPDAGGAGAADHQPGQNIDQRRFAGAVRAQQPEDRAARYLQADPVERADAAAGLGAVGLGQCLRLDSELWGEFGCVP